MTTTSSALLMAMPLRELQRRPLASPGVVQSSPRDTVKRESAATPAGLRRKREEAQAKLYSLMSEIKPTILSIRRLEAFTVCTNKFPPPSDTLRPFRMIIDPAKVPLPNQSNAVLRPFLRDVESIPGPDGVLWPFAIDPSSLPRVSSALRPFSNEVDKMHALGSSPLERFSIDVRDTRTDSFMLQMKLEKKQAIIRLLQGLLLKARLEHRNRVLATLLRRKRQHKEEVLRRVLERKLQHKLQTQAALRVRLRLSSS